MGVGRGGRGRGKGWVRARVGVGRSGRGVQMWSIAKKEGSRVKCREGHEEQVYGRAGV